MTPDSIKYLYGRYILKWEHAMFKLTVQFGMSDAEAKAWLAR